MMYQSECIFCERNKCHAHGCAMCGATRANDDIDTCDNALCIVEFDRAMRRALASLRQMEETRDAT